MNQAIVSGGAGFIGSVVVRRLLESDIDVLAIGRKPWDAVDPHRLSRHPRLTYVQVDMADIGSLPESARRQGWNPDGTCVFYNFAWGGTARLSDLDVGAQMRNVGWSANAFTVAGQMRCRKFVHVGTMEEVFTRRYLDLDYHVHSYYNRHVVYSLAKIASTNALKLLAGRSDVGLIIATNSHVMGPYDDKDSFLRVTLEKLIDGEPLIFSTGEQMFDVIAVGDCGRAYQFIGQKGIPGREYWVGSGQARPLKQYVEIMAGLYPSGQPLQFGKMPYNDISLALSDFSIERLQRDTGFEPLTSYEDAVHELHRWLMAARTERARGGAGG